VAKGRLAYGSGGVGDSKATGSLLAMLESVPPEDRAAAEAVAPAMFAAFLAKAGTVEAAGHKFSWFVEDFNALRVAVLAAAQAPRRDVERDYRPPKLVFTKRPRAEGKG
jgi:hypothetical protein